MVRSFGLVDSKVQEAEYFLDRVLEADLDFFGVQCDTVAFAASARSITFAMQSSLTGVDGFGQWYRAKQDQLREDTRARFFHEFRRVSQHIGHNVVTGGSFRDGKFLFFFGATPELKKVPDEDVASACVEYFKTVLEVVYQCYLEFNPVINGQWRFTPEHFELLEKTIEDAEEELGLYPGSTDLPGSDEADRWSFLRRHADGCKIQAQFERWLDKRVPHPDDE